MFTKVALFLLFAVVYTFSEAKAEAEKPAEVKPTVLSEAFDDMDNDNDNQVTEKEFDYYFEEHGLPKSLAEEAFKKADKNGNGKISKEEFESWAEDAAKAAGAAKPK